MEYKTVIVGGGGVGKSAITIQFIHNHFVEGYDPTIEDAYRKQIVIDNEPCLMDILDTAGQEEFSAMRDMYFNSGEAFILTYAITSRSSFDEVISFRNQALRVKNKDNIPMVLVGNKCDLEKHRQVTKLDGENLAKSWNIPFFESSALLRINIDEIFTQIIRDVRRINQGKVIGGKKKKNKVKCNIL